MGLSAWVAGACAPIMRDGSRTLKIDIDGAMKPAWNFVVKNTHGNVSAGHGSAGFGASLLSAAGGASALHVLAGGTVRGDSYDLLEKRSPTADALRARVASIPVVGSRMSSLVSTKHYYKHHLFETRGFDQLFRRKGLLIFVAKHLALASYSDLNRFNSQLAACERDDTGETPAPDPIDWVAVTGRFLVNSTMEIARMGLQWLIHRHVVASCEPRTAWKLMKKLPESCARKAARFASAALSSRLARKPYLMARTAIRTCAIWALVDGAVTFAVDVARHLHALLFGSPTVPAAVDDDGVHPPPRAVMPGHWQFLASRGISAALRVTVGLGVQAATVAAFVQLAPSEKTRLAAMAGGFVGDIGGFVLASIIAGEISSLLPY